MVESPQLWPENRRDPLARIARSRPEKKRGVKRLRRTGLCRTSFEDVSRSLNIARGPGGHISHRVAGGEGLAGILRAVEASQCAGLSVEIGDDFCGSRRRGGPPTGFRSPLLFCRVDLADVVNAGAPLGIRPRSQHVGDRDGCQQADDADDDHDFGEREARSLGQPNFHINRLTFLAV